MSTITTSPSFKRPAKRRAVKRATVKSTPGVKASVFVRAARFIANGQEEFACHALVLAVEGDHFYSHHTPPERTFFEAVLRPPPPNDNSAWYWTPDTNTPDEDQFARTLGLLLCAELVKDGFVPLGWEATS